MQHRNTPTLFIVVFAMFVSVILTAQDAVASSDRMFAIGRTGTGQGGGSGDSTLLEVTLDPFAATTIGTSTGVKFSGIDFDPVSGTLYGGSVVGAAQPPHMPGSLYTVDITDGTATLVGGYNNIGGQMSDIAFDNDGNLYGVDFHRLWNINTTTGEATLIGDLDGDPNANLTVDLEAIAVDPTTDILYGLDWNDGELWVIDKSTGLATSQGLFTGFGSRSPTGFGIDSSGNFFASIGGGANSSTSGEIYSLDPSDFSVSLLGDAFAGSVTDIAFQRVSAGPAADFDLDEDVDGADFLAWQRGLGTIYNENNLSDWEAEFGTVPAAAVVSAVPEPSALALLMLGAIGLVFSVRTRAHR